MTEVISIQQLASIVGVTRQAVDIAYARSADAPQPVLTTAGGRYFDPEELHVWWLRRMESQWQSRRGPDQVRGSGPGTQVNMKLKADALAALDALRKPDETRAAAARRVLVAALLNRQEVSA